MRTDRSHLVITTNGGFSPQLLLTYLQGASMILLRGRLLLTTVTTQWAHRIVTLSVSPFGEGEVLLLTPKHHQEKERVIQSFCHGVGLTPGIGVGKQKP